MKKNRQVSSLRSQAGNLEIIIIIVVIVALLVGLGVYFWIRTASGSGNDANTSSQNQSTNTSQGNASTISMLNGGLKVAAVDGWTKAYETMLTKEIDGTTFKIGAQPQGVDFLKSDTVGGYAAELTTVTTAQNTTLHLLKLGKSQETTNLVVSTCAPANGFGCSPDLDGKKLYFFLAPYDANATLNYSLPATTTAIGDFETIAKSLPF